MHIIYTNKGGAEYAVLAKSIRNGAKVNKEYINLGRVLDKERNIFRNRERGVFTYSIETNTYGPAPADFNPPPKRRRGHYHKVGRKKKSYLVLQFGDLFFYDMFFKSTGLAEAVNAIGYSNKDTLNALLAYYVTSNESNYRAEDWFELSYAKVLYPNAVLSSQRISEALEEIGLEENKRLFFSKYLDFVRSCQMNDTKEDFKMIPAGSPGDGILVDSSGLPNSSRIPVTAINNHNGKISEEVRLVYIVQQKTGLPLYFRYVSGNVIDSSTITRTIHELNAMKIDTKFALLDAGYYTGVNADALMDAKISFVTRVHSNHKIFKQAKAKLRKTLESKNNLVYHNGRIVYIASMEVKIGQKANHKAYGYFCLDTTMQNEERKHLAQKAQDENMASSDIYDELQEKGLFMLVSTRRIAKKNLLPLYYTRNQVEEIFKIGKSNGKMLPICVEKEETLRGHLLMTFISSTILKILGDRLLDYKMSASEIFSILRHQQALVFENELITTEPVRKMNDIYKLFKIKCPDSIDYNPTDEELARM